jgi:hypothetical protein
MRGNHKRQSLLDGEVVEAVAADLARVEVGVGACVHVVHVEQGGLRLAHEGDVEARGVPDERAITKGTLEAQP